MEHQTINAYGNNYKPAPEGFDWLCNHEFSHEWFGNQLTNGDWDDMWLHEGFGSYMQPVSLAWLNGRMGYDAAMFKQRQTIANKYPIVSGKHQTEEEVYDPKSGPGGDIYVQGQLGTAHAARTDRRPGFLDRRPPRGLRPARSQTRQFPAALRLDQ